jgi:hypothetical protein
MFVVVPCVAAQAQYYTEPYNYSSTLEEGIQRGYADVVRAYGMANLLNSQAMGQVEQARKQYIENQVKATQAYFELRRYMAEARHAERPMPLSLEQYVRLARDSAPAPLTATQLDPLTGVINWPKPLMLPEFTGFRQRIDQLFQQRASGYIVFLPAQKAIQEFIDVLNSQANVFDAKDFVASRRFLDSLLIAAKGVQS